MMTTMRIMMIWLTVSRPALYPLIPIIFILGYQAGGGSMSTAPWTIWLFLSALTGPLSMILYGINDINDEITDSQSLVRSWASGLVLNHTKHRVVWCGIIIAVVILLLTAWLLSQQTFFIACGAIVAAYLYSVPPIRLKEQPFTDALFSGFFYVVVIYALGFTLQKPFIALPVEIWSLALLATVLHMYAAARDYTADRNAAMVTTATYIGRRNTILLSLFLTVSAGLWWWYWRTADFAEGLLFITFLTTFFLAWYFDDELFIKKSLYAVVVVTMGVGVYKLFF